MTARSYVAVIDGDESVCRALGRLLQGAGLYPVMYGSAEAYLEDRMRVQFDCLLVDVQLRGMTGLELHRRLSACQILTPVIFITADDEPQTRVKALQGGCAAYFRKTDAGVDIVAAIWKAIEKSPQLARSPS